MEIRPGDKAPEFTLRASDKAQIHLKDYRGKNVLLLFFPLAFTGVCTKEMQEMNASLAEFEKLNTQILAISVDSIYALERWKLDLGFDFPLLSDFNKTVSKKYGCLYKTFVFEMKGVSKRSAFVIDREGTIRYAEVLENAGDLPDFKAIRKILEGLEG